MAEQVQREADGRALGGTHIRVSFCAPGPPGRSMLAALIAAQTMALNRGKGLLPEPTAMQILTGLSNPATLKMLLNPLTQGRKQGLLGAAPTMPLLANPALSAALLQLLLQNQAQVQQAGLVGDTLLAAMPLQQGVHLLGDLPQGVVVPSLGLHSDPMGPINPHSMGRPLGRESPTSFSQNPSPTLQGMSISHLGGVMGAEGPTAPGLSILGHPPNNVNLPQNPFNVHSLFPSGTNCRPHPYRKRPALGNSSNQRTQNIHCNYRLRYQESYTPDYPPIHQDPLGHLYEQQEALDTGALAGFGQQVNHLHYSHPAFKLRHLLPFLSLLPFMRPMLCGSVLIPEHCLSVQAVGMPPVIHSNTHASGLGMKTPVGGHKRLIPSPEPSPEGGYVGQHSQGLGGHYADSYLKRKRIF
ncbi:unnamed protein product [Oncorhynchus mykiss]|uniref:Uncharacterized protein n=1 Tax=Oncorhynchus mykiss TaxID=8022 RepID=A0A060XK70_ONCMY|nr:unnamed protein product [Oncorhynchus mykiss]